MSIDPSERGWTYHRNREHPTPDPREPPIKQIKFYLDRYRIKEALQIFFDENTLRLLHAEPDFMWDIIPLICKRLRGLCQYRFRVFEGCERMLCRIAVDESCNPKEVLISLLAEIGQQDQCQDDNVFRAMIRPLEGTLLRMNCPSPRDENLRWVLSVLIRHINEIELPKEYNLEGKKRLALPNDPSVKRFIEVLPLLLSFVEEFNDRSMELEKSPMPILTESQIDEVLNGDLLDDDIMDNMHSSIGDSLISSITTLSALMYRPLSFLDLTSHCDELKLFANRCLNTLIRLRPDLFSPIYKRLTEHTNPWSMENSDGKSSYSLTCSESTISLATCSYIYRCERLISPNTIQSFPQVITDSSVLFCHLPYVVALLEKSEVLVHEKGLVLLESLMRNISNDSLGQKFMDDFESLELHRQLFRIMVFSPLDTNRRKAYDLFICSCDLLTYSCKFQVFKNVLSQSDLRPCIRAACIDQYRRHLTNIYRELVSFNEATSSTPSAQKEERKQESSDSLSSESVSSGLSQNDNSIMEEVCLKSDIEAHTLCDLETCSLSSGDMKALLYVQRLISHYKSIGGQSLVEFLNLCVDSCLSSSQHTGIIENYEIILATLTMLRFLKLRKTVFKSQAEEEYLDGRRLKKLFFDPIRNAIALIINELKSHHKNMETSQESKSFSGSMGCQPESELDLLARILGPKLDEFIDASDDKFSGLGKQDEAECLDWALCRLDLVESVLVRTCDLYNC